MSDRRVVLIDVDGPVADMNPEWLRIYNEEFGDTLTCEQITAWHIHQFVKPEAKKRIYEYLDLPTLYERVLPEPGALNGIRQLKEWGFYTVLLTACTRGMLTPKTEWLYDHGFMKAADMLLPIHMYPGRHPDKSIVFGDIIIDDRPRNLTEHPALLKMLYDKPWNKEDEKLYRVFDWAGILNTVDFHHMRGTWNVNQ